MNFRIGQKVVCVDAKPRHANVPCALREGSIYVVSGFGRTGGVLVHGCRAVFQPEKGFYSDRFRPVVEKKTDISIFTEMLKPNQRELISP